MVQQCNSVNWPPLEWPQFHSTISVVIFIVLFQNSQPKTHAGIEILQLYCTKDAYIDAYLMKGTEVLTLKCCYNMKFWIHNIGFFKKLKNHCTNVTNFCILNYFLDYPPLSESFFESQ